MSRWCGKCGEEFANAKELFAHLRNDNCEALVEEHNAIYEEGVVPKSEYHNTTSAAPEGRPHDKAVGREGDGSGRPLLHHHGGSESVEQHQLDLADWADWGED